MVYFAVLYLEWCQLFLSLLKRCIPNHIIDLFTNHKALQNFQVQKYENSPVPLFHFTLAFLWESKTFFVSSFFSLHSYLPRRQFVYVAIFFWSPYSFAEFMGSPEPFTTASCYKSTSLFPQITCFICQRFLGVLEDFLYVLKCIDYTYSKMKGLHYCASSNRSSDL